MPLHFVLEDVLFSLDRDGLAVMNSACNECMYKFLCFGTES